MAPTDCNVALPQLPILQPTIGTAPSRKRGRGRWRALALGGVHVLILLHIAHYLLYGRTLSPMEPSEAMYTLELGYVNTGALLLGLAIMTTVVFGRFFCGWACHLVALQDLCSFILRRLHVHPKPIRSRALGILPYVLAFYMFIWPTLIRKFQGGHHPGFSNQVLTSNFWGTFPGPAIAILTLTVCGGLIVCLLGNKGFCTYACPYGALFAIADRAAFGRIRVTDACTHCGHCTAICSSNVLVHEEVRNYGMVVDSGCMKCMDCVSSCPNDALYFGLTSAPSAAAARRGSNTSRRHYDYPLVEDIVALTVAGIVTFALRGLYGGPPLLLALALGSITGFVTIVLLRLTKRLDVRLQHWTLRKKGQLTSVGRVFVVGLVAWFVFITHSTYVQYHTYRGNRLLGQASVTWDDLIMGSLRAPLLSPERRNAVYTADEHFRKAENQGLMEIAEVQIGRGCIALLTDDAVAAEAHLQRAYRCQPSASALGEILFDLRPLVVRQRTEVEGAQESIQRTHQQIYAE